MAVRVFLFAAHILLIALAIVFSSEVRAAADAAPAQPGAFALSRVDGSKLDDIELEGEPYGVMFGFTHCPDVCPTALAELTLALKASPRLQDDFKVYFIAADIERDTSKNVGSYLGAFDPRIVGLTGSAEQVAEAASAFGAVARRKDLPHGDYTIEHTAALFLVDGDGLIADRVSFTSPFDEIAKRIAAVAGR